MNKSSNTKSAVSITTPKGTLLAQINNLRKQLKDIKISKKQTNVLTEKSIKEFSSSLNRKPSKQKCVTSASNLVKDKFFKSNTKQDYSTVTNNIKSSNFVFETQKSFQIFDKKQKKIHKKSSQKVILEQDQSQHIQIQAVLSEIFLKQKDRKLKLDIQLNKLRKILVKNVPLNEIFSHLNYIISLINVSTRQYANRIDGLQRNQKDDSSQQILLIKRQQQQINHLTQKLLESQNQLKQLKQAHKVRQQNDQQIQKINQINGIQKSQLHNHIQQLQNAVKELQQHSISLQEQNRILETKLIKKEQQLIMINQDVKYLRLQTENYKQLKQQNVELYQNTLQEYRDYKRAKHIQIQKITAQKQKWQNECKMRRNQSQQIKQLQDQKLSLMKQISQLRQLCTIRSLQLDDKKAIMHENQKKVITLQSQLYKLKSQVQTLRNQKQYSQFQNQKLKEQLKDIKKYNKKQYAKDNINQLTDKNVRSHSKQNVNSLSKQKVSTTYHTKQNQGFKSQSQIQLNNQNYDQNQQNDEFQLSVNKKKTQQFNKSLKQRQQKLKALDDIHSLIRKHKNQMQI